MRRSSRAPSAASPTRRRRRPGPSPSARRPASGPRRRARRASPARRSRRWSGSAGEPGEKPLTGGLTGLLQFAGHPMTYRAASVLLLATCAVAGAGCKKEQESLVVATLRLAAADPAGMDLRSVKLAATPGREATFDKVTMLSATEDTQVGLYLPGDVTGTVRIVATAYPRMGCAGFRGM